MDADLVRPACLQTALDQCCVTQDFDASPMRYGALPASTFDYRNLFAVGRRPGERRIHGAFHNLRNAAYDGEIAPFDTVRGELPGETLVGHVGLGDHEQSRRILVDPVNDARAGDPADA
jgi:hypothetical protein